ncbi:MAG: MgtC/SapB family protein [Desulfomonilaceae bacterium]
MTGDLIDIVTHLGIAAVAGGLIGFERSYHGRPAGFRTHTLVCMASSLLMLVTIYQKQWFSLADIETVRIDPTRMAQGVMTGIGFLGAGVIMKEALSVRGLTTAASIWITAAIGILAGVGFYSAAFVGTVFALVVVLVFRWIETRIPTLAYARLTLRFRRDMTMPETELLALITSQGFSVANMSYSADREDNFFEYSMTIRTPSNDSMRSLPTILSATESITEFHIHQTGD